MTISKLNDLCESLHSIRTLLKDYDNVNLDQYNKGTQDTEDLGKPTDDHGGDIKGDNS